VFFFFFFLVGWSLNLGLILAKQALYPMSHTSSPFYSGYFGDGGLMNCLPRLVLNLNPPDLGLPSSWDYSCELLTPS
jgi:hypothetical protein